jgi:Fe-S cluster assembly protein SufD
MSATTLSQLADRLATATPAPADGSAVGTLRAAGLTGATQLGWPTSRLEAWKNTSVAALVGGAWRAGPTAAPSPDALAALPAAWTQPLAPTSARLVFVDGVAVPAMATAAPAGIAVGTLTASVNVPEAVRAQLGRLGLQSTQAFAALNAAALHDAAWVYAPRGTAGAAHVELVFISTVAAAGAVTCPRVLVVADVGAEVSVVERYVGTAATASWTNAVTEVVVHDNARVRHLVLQEEGDAAYHMGVLGAELARDARLEAFVLAMGGVWGRREASVRLAAPGAHAVLGGLTMGLGSQHLDTQVLVDHAAPHGTSTQTFKGVLDDKATGVFSGKVKVAKHAVKTDARQLNRNLLLTKGATAFTRPQLEILADDVKCSHGATVGQLDDDALFYLRSRGLGLDEARQMLTFAFAGDVLQEVSAPDLRAACEARVRARLPLGRQGERS